MKLGEAVLHFIGHGCLLLPNSIIILSAICYFHLWYISLPVFGHCAVYIPIMMVITIPYAMSVIMHVTLWCFSQSLCCCFTCRRFQKQNHTEKESLIRQREENVDFVSPLINSGVIMLNFIIVVSIIVEILVIVAGLAVVVASIFTQPAKYQGYQIVHGIDSDIQIIRNIHGHIHVKAKTKKDMFFGQGYAQAQERIFQMELGKRLATGRLSEILGPSAMETDTLNRAIGYEKYGKINAENLSPIYKTYITSFVQGINSYIETNYLFFPLEFKLLNTNPSKWKIEDVIAFSLWAGNSQSTNYEIELERLNYLLNVGLKPERIEQFFTSPDKSKSTILNLDHLNSLNLTMNENERNLLQQSLKKEFEFLYEFQSNHRDTRNHSKDEGLTSDLKREYSSFNSNNFAISGKLTNSGSAIVESDPHTGLAAPNFYFTIHIETEGLYNAQGASIAGIPSIVIGKNDFISWGATNPLVDTVDLFIIESNENQTHYYRNNQWVEFINREETFHIKDSESVKRIIKETVYGPIIPNTRLSHRPNLLTAFSSSLFVQNNTAFESFIEIGEARNWNNFTNALKKYTFSPISFVYGDIEGNIGYYVPGRLPIRSSGHSGRYPTYGNGSYDWQGFVPFDELPHIYNPPEGYVITANNKIAPDTYKHRLSYYYAPGYRATRIEEMIKSLGSNITVEDVTKIQLDEYATDFLGYQPIFARFNFSNEGSYFEEWLEKLKKWDGNSAANQKSTEATIYFFWYRCYRKVHEEEASHSRIAMEPFLRYTIENSTVFCPPNRTCLQFAEQCLLTTLKQLNLNEQSYRWGVDLHGQSFKNQIYELMKFPCLGSRRALRGGNAYSVNTAWHVDPELNSITGKYEIENNYGSTYRQIVHLGHHDSKFVLGMGQSGNIFSKNYDDAVEPWRKGEYFPMENEFKNPKYLLILKK